MKRFYVTNSDNYTYKFYYKSLEECKRRNPNCKVEECFDFEYLNTIELMNNKSDFIGLDNKGRKVYKFITNTFNLYYKILEDDGLLLDCAYYQLWEHSRFTNPISWTVCDINDLYDRFFNIDPLIFRLHSYRIYGQPKLAKPKELNKISSCFSVDFIPNKCKCQCFIKDNDLWIKHRDWFSQDMKESPEDFGTPLEYRSNKYLEKGKKNKFIYPDAWGSIVCRNEAWISFENIIPQADIYKNETLLGRELLKVFSKFHKVSDLYFEDSDWKFFFDRVARELLKYLEINK